MCAYPNNIRGARRRHCSRIHNDPWPDICLLECLYINMRIYIYIYTYINTFRYIWLVCVNREEREGGRTASGAKYGNWRLSGKPRSRAPTFQDRGSVLERLRRAPGCLRIWIFTSAHRYPRTTIKISYTTKSRLVSKLTRFSRRRDPKCSVRVSMQIEWRTKNKTSEKHFYSEQVTIEH